jgi:TolB protein
MKKTVVFFLVAACSGLAFAEESPARKLTYEQNDAVWVANLDGSAPKKIAGGQSPDLSPDGTRLAYNTVQEVGQPAHRQIAVADLATGQTAIFKDIPSDNCMEPRWSPDGKQLLFDYYTDNERRIGLVNADGTGFRYVQQSEPKHQSYWAAAWAADGRSFFAEDMLNLYQLDLDAKILKKWAVEKLVPHGGMSGNVRLDASPDGKTLLMDIEMDEKERKGWDGPPASIWTLDLATEKTARLTPESLYAWDCHWLDAPDSILFVSQGPGEKNPSIYRMSAKGQGKDRKLLVKDASIPGAR